MLASSSSLSLAPAHAHARVHRRGAADAAMAPSRSSRSSRVLRLASSLSLFALLVLLALLLVLSPSSSPLSSCFSSSPSAASSPSSSSSSSSSSLLPALAQQVGTPATTTASTTVGRPVARHTFLPPYDMHVPNWRVGAGASVNTTFVRLTPAKQSRTGYVWSATPSSMSDWEVEFEFRVEGLLHLGGDGLAFWYTEKPEMIGNVYGSVDYWVGLGIFFDTFNNDGVGSNPFITAVYNDGTQRFDAHSDGASQALASCTIDIRNPQVPSVARIRYERKVLSLHVAMRRNSASGEPDFQQCFSVSELELGVDKFFGITAHTGDVADSHDVYSFRTTDLSPINVDLAAIRQQYLSTLQRQHASPSHLEMTQQDFQHSVLTTLSQIQEELNLVQLNSITMVDSLHNQQMVSGGVRPGGAAAGSYDDASAQHAASASSTLDGDRLSRLQQRVEQQSQQFGVVSDQQNDLLREVRSVQQSVSALVSQVTAVGSRMTAAGAAAAAGAGGAGGASTSDDATAASLRQLLETVTVVSRRVDELASTVVGFKEEEVRLTQQLIQQVTALQTVVNANANAVGGGAGGGGLSWFAFLLLVLIAVLSATLTFFTFSQHMKNQRYKLI